MKSLEQSITDHALAQGFALVGFAPLRRLEHREDFFRRWLDDGRAAEMAGWRAIPIAGSIRESSIRGRAQ